MNDLNKYGFSRTQLSSFILGSKSEKIQKKVILAPCWIPESVGIMQIELISNSPPLIWNGKLGNMSFTYIVAGIGAGVCSDVVMSLSDTICTELLFIGSAGAINERIHIGDILIPDSVVSADGMCRYLYDDVRIDRYGFEYIPNPIIQKYLKRAAETSLAIRPEIQINLHVGRAISVETIYSQFRHIDSFREMKCDCVDMESAAVLRSSECIGVKAGIVYCVSDNAVLKQSLVTVSESETAFRKNVRLDLMPTIIEAFLNNNPV